MESGQGEWIACHECDLVLAAPAVPEGGAARCPRCKGILFREKRDSLDRTLALTVAGIVLYLVANTFPFLSFHMQGQVTQTTLGSGVIDLLRQDYAALAILVAVTAILAPAVHLGSLLYMLLPLKLGRVPTLLAPVFRLVRRIQPWSMMEVFMLGILVSVVKLSDMAHLEPGLALWSFALLIVVLSAAEVSLDRRMIWRRAEELS